MGQSWWGRGGRATEARGLWHERDSAGGPGSVFLLQTTQRRPPLSVRAPPPPPAHCPLLPEPGTAEGHVHTSLGGCRAHSSSTVPFPPPHGHTSAQASGSRGSSLAGRTVWGPLRKYGQSSGSGTKSVGAAWKRRRSCPHSREAQGWRKEASRSRSAHSSGPRPPNSPQAAPGEGESGPGFVN